MAPTGFPAPLLLPMVVHTQGPSSSTSSRAPASGSGNTTTGGFDFGAFGSGLGEGSTTEPGATPPDFFTATIDFSSLKAGPAEGAGGGAGGDGFDDFFRSVLLHCPLHAPLCA